MSMTNEYDDHDERVKRLQDFAGTSEGARGRDMVDVASANLLQSMDRVYGAQKVAIYRDETVVMQRLKKAAAAAGEDWYYRWPVKAKIKNEQTGKEEWTTTYIEGPSIKLTDDLARLFGNCDLDTRSMDLGDSWLFLSRFIDLETGYSRTRPYQQRKSQKSIKGDADRARDIAYQIGCSKAERNVVVHALRNFADFAYQEARHSLVEKIGKDLPRWRDRVLDGLAKQGVDKIRVERVVGRTVDAWLAPDIASVIASMKAVADGMASWDDTFPIPVATTAASTGDEHVDPETGEVTATAANDGSATKANGNAKTMSLDDFAATSEDHGQAGGDALQSGASSSRGAQSAGHPEEAHTQSAGRADSPAAHSAGGGGGPNKTPTNETEYEAWFAAWFANLADPAAAALRWTNEKKLRNACHVTEKVRDRLKAFVDSQVGKK